MNGYDIVAVRSLGVCEKCGTARAEQMHHRQARGMGGSKVRNGAENLLHLCSPCHAWVEANPAASYENGWKVRCGCDPAATPFTRWGTPIHITNEGTYE